MEVWRASEAGMSVGIEGGTDMGRGAIDVKDGERDVAAGIDLAVVSVSENTAPGGRIDPVDERA